MRRWKVALTPSPDVGPPVGRVGVTVGWAVEVEAEVVEAVFVVVAVEVGVTVVVVVEGPGGSKEKIITE